MRRSSFCGLVLCIACVVLDLQEVQTAAVRETIPKACATQDTGGVCQHQGNSLLQVKTLLTTTTAEEPHPQREKSSPASKEGEEALPQLTASSRDTGPQVGKAGYDQQNSSATARSLLQGIASAYRDLVEPWLLGQSLTRLTALWRREGFEKTPISMVRVNSSEYAKSVASALEPEVGPIIGITVGAVVILAACVLVKKELEDRQSPYRMGQVQSRDFQALPPPSALKGRTPPTPLSGFVRSESQVAFARSESYFEGSEGARVGSKQPQPAPGVLSASQTALPTPRLNTPRSVLSRSDSLSRVFSPQPQPYDVLAMANSEGSIMPNPFPSTPSLPPTSPLAGHRPSDQSISWRRFSLGERSLCPGLVVPQSSECFLVMPIPEPDTQLSYVKDLDGKPVIRCEVNRPNWTIFKRQVFAKLRAAVPGAEHAQERVLCRCEAALRQGGRRSAFIYDESAQLFAHVARDPRGIGYVLSVASRTASDFQMRFCGSLDESLRIENSNQELLAETEIVKMNFAPGQPYMKLHILAGVDVGMVLCGLLCMVTMEAG